MQLLELVYDELSDVLRSDVVAHLEQCDDCRREHNQLQLGRRLATQLPVETPGPLSDRVLAALAAHTSSTVAVADLGAPKSTPEVLPPTSNSVPETPTPDNVVRAESRWLDRLAALAMRREIAMAAVFVLAVGVGITTLYAPSQRSTTLGEQSRSQVIPAVEVNADPSPSGPTHAHAQHGSVHRDPAPERARADRAEGRAQAASRSAATAPSSALPPSPAALPWAPQPEQAPAAIAAPQRTQERVEMRAQALSPSAPFGAQMGQSAQAPTTAPAQEPARSVTEQRAHLALAQGNVDEALTGFRAVLAGAEDDVTRARMRREIASAEQTLAQQTASESTSSAQAGTASAVRQTGPTPARRVAAPSMRRAVRPRPSGSQADSFSNLAY
ncbi:MAG: hypothetical protein Q8Q09_03320 [Deltaproteobacteria bacterium]|nr:hypothetical protein [Deltaproteobacteria bacterium]